MGWATAGLAFEQPMILELYERRISEDPSVFVSCVLYLHGFSDKYSKKNPFHTLKVNSDEISFKKYCLPIT